MAKILIATDESPTSFERVKDWLAEWSHSCDVVSPLELLFLNLETVALLLVDADLPTIDNLALIKHLKEHPRYHTIPVIILTSNIDEKYLDAYSEQGDVDFIAKPIQKLTLKVRIKCNLIVYEHFVEMQRQYKALTDHTAELSQTYEELRQEFAIHTRVEKALWEEHYFLATILDTLEALVVVFDCHGRIVSFNRACQQITGYSPAEVLNKHAWDLFLIGEELEMSKNSFAHIQADHFPNQHQNYWLTKEGEQRLITWTNNIILDANDSVRYVIGTGIDVTQRVTAEQELRNYRDKLEILIEERTAKLLEVNVHLEQEIAQRKKVEQKLRQSEERLKAQFKGMPIPTYIWQYHDDDFKLIDYNDAAKVITKDAIINFVGHSFKEMYHDMPDVITDMWACFNQRSSRKKTMTYRFRNTDIVREFVVSYVFVPPDLIMVHTDDITEQKQAEETLLQSESRLAAAQQIARLGNWDWNISTNKLYWSDEIYRIFGLNPQQFGATYEDFLKRVHPDDRKMVVTSIEETLAQKASCNLDHRIVLPDGRVRVVHEQAELALDKQGQPIRLIGTVQDITERKQTEEQLKASLREKDVLLKEIHHRIKNNLQVVSSLLELQSDYVEDEQSRAMFRESQNRLKSMALVHEWLYQTKNLSTINFADYVDNLTDHLFRSHGAENIRLQCTITSVFLSIETAIPCGLIIHELVSNALKYAFPRSSSQGSQAEERREIQIELHATKPSAAAHGLQLTLVVKDNGIGLPANVNLRQAKSLGLTLVMTLVGQLKGTIALNSRAGTEFKIIFSDPVANLLKQ